MAVLVAPSILSADFGRLAEEVGAVESAGADLIHVDVMDGRFVPNITVGPPVVAAIRKATRLPLDVHLMIVEPERYVEAFAQAGASRISVHVEACPHLHRTLQQIERAGAMPAVALNPATPVSALEEAVELAGMILVMSVNPGFGGQSFIPQTIEKLGRLKGLLRRTPRPDIEVDGGVTPDNAGALVAAGATVLVAGTAVFRAKSYFAAISSLRGA